jgi:hypothetical protein
MKLREAITLLESDVYCTRENLLDADILTARASDLMSEVLAQDAVPDILITGLCNAQVIRTASVFGIKAVVFVRGRTPGQKVIDLAMDENVVILTTVHSLFVSCGRLFANGVRGTARRL